MDPAYGVAGDVHPAGAREGDAVLARPAQPLVLNNIMIAMIILLLIIMMHYMIVNLKLIE